MGYKLYRNTDQATSTDAESVLKTISFKSLDSAGP
jgi:hypothetical protein